MQLLIIMLKTLFRLYTTQECSRIRPARESAHTQTSAYIQKKRIVKNIWIFSGMLMLVFPALPSVILITLTTTFTSFVILDETDGESNSHDRD